MISRQSLARFGVEAATQGQAELGERFDMEGYLAAHGFEVLIRKPWQSRPGGLIYELAVCPLNPDHTGGSAAFTMKDGKPVAVQKILMTNDHQRSAATLVELYALRWQIELFFKELKSTLGWHQYRFRRFTKVEGWTIACLFTFLYLEWYRSQHLRQRRLTAKETPWWRWQRTYGLCQAVRQDADDMEIHRLAEWTRTRGGIKKLKKHMRAAVPAEYRKAC